jgi:sarcosine oxidase
MDNRFEVIVIGLGAMGSAAVYQLAQRRRRVLGIDRYSPPHARGSSHGETRIIRQAIGEGEAYVPLVLRSYELWREIESASGSQLLTVSGGLVLESQRSAAAATEARDFFARTVSCAEQFSIPHEIIGPKDLARRYPQFAVTDEIGYFERGAGYLRPELCIAAQLALAERAGAVLHTGESVSAIEASGVAELSVRSDRSIYRAERVVITAGPWLPHLLGSDETELFKVYRQVMHWFRIGRGFEAAFGPDKFPVFIWIFQRRGHIGFYGFPSQDGRSIKVASEQYSITTSPETMNRAVSEEEARSMHAQCVEGRLPAISSASERAVTCLYTRTPDGNFVIDFWRNDPRILIVSPCSGHGFKHSAALGEAVAQLILDGRSAIDTSAFKLSRFARGA